MVENVRRGRTNAARTTYYAVAELGDVINVRKDWRGPAGLCLAVSHPPTKRDRYPLPPLLRPGLKRQQHFLSEVGRRSVRVDAAQEDHDVAVGGALRHLHRNAVHLAQPLG